MKGFGPFKWFAHKESKNYGKLIDGRGREYFIHGTDVLDEINEYNLNEIYIFNYRSNSKGFVATDCRRLSTWNDLILLFENPNSSESISFMRKRERVSINIITKGIDQFKENNSEIDFPKKLINFFKNVKDISLYQNTFEILSNSLTDHSEYDPLFSAISKLDRLSQGIKRILWFKMYLDKMTTIDLMNMVSKESDKSHIILTLLKCDSDQFSPVFNFISFLNNIEKIVFLQDIKIVINSTLSKRNLSHDENEKPLKRKLVKYKRKELERSIERIRLAKLKNYDPNVLNSISTEIFNKRLYQVENLIEEVLKKENNPSIIIQLYEKKYKVEPESQDIIDNSALIDLTLYQRLLTEEKLSKEESTLFLKNKITSILLDDKTPDKIEKIQKFLNTEPKGYLDEDYYQLIQIVSDQIKQLLEKERLKDEELDFIRNCYFSTLNFDTQTIKHLQEFISPDFTKLIVNFCKNYETFDKVEQVEEIKQKCIYFYKGRNRNNRLQFLTNYKLDEYMNKVFLKVVEENFDPIMKYRLWMHNYLDNIDVQNLINAISDQDANAIEVEKILAKCNESQFRLIDEGISHLDSYKIVTYYENAFRTVNKQAYPNFKELLYSDQIASINKGRYFIEAVKRICQNETNFGTSLRLFSSGYKNELNYSDLIANIDSIRSSLFNKIANSAFLSEVQLANLSKEIIEANYFQKPQFRSRQLWDFSDLKKVLKYIKATTNKERQVIYHKISSILSDTQEYELWKEGLSHILPKKKFIKEVLNKDDSFSFSKEIIETNKDQLANLLFESIQELNDNIESKEQCINLSKLVSFSIEYELIANDDFQELNSNLVTLLVWIFEKKFSTIDQSLFIRSIFLLPFESQKSGVRKLFKCIQDKVININLHEFSTALKNQLVKSKYVHFPDITMILVFTSLAYFEKNNKFLKGGAIIKIFIQNHKILKDSSTKIEGYFSRCTGRTEKVFNSITNGSVRLNPDKSIFYITFEYDEDIVESIRKVPGRRWDEAIKLWTVPYASKHSMFEFIQKHSFEIKVEGQGYKTTNKHLFYDEVSAIPEGRKFCDGRQANKKHDFHNIDFWSCNNQPCFKACRPSSLQLDWQSFSFYDFAKVLGFDMTEYKTNPNDVVIDGKYIQFVSWLNRAQQILSRLFCENCDKILHPWQTAHYAKQSIVKFRCTNQTCEESHKADAREAGAITYLNHCFNSKCNAIIDSRVSKKCPNGLWICESCGCCCSQSFFQRRLSHLKEGDNFDNAGKQSIYSDTKTKYDYKQGHLDRAEYFCHIDGSKMKEIGEEVFCCNECDNSYDTKQYRLERPNRHLVNTTYGDPPE